MESLTGGTGI